MHEILFSPFIIPLGAFLMVVAIIGITAWKKVREKELDQERELRLREMEHARKMKEMDLEMARAKGEKPQDS